VTNHGNNFNVSARIFEKRFAFNTEDIDGNRRLPVITPVVAVHRLIVRRTYTVRMAWEGSKIRESVLHSCSSVSPVRRILLFRFDSLKMSTDWIWHVQHVNWPGADPASRVGIGDDFSNIW